MKRSHLLYILQVLVLGVLGCDAVNLPSSDQASTNNADTQQGGDSGTIPTDGNDSLSPDDVTADEGSGVDTNDTTSTLEQQVVIGGTIDAADAIGQGVAAILPVKDLQAIFEGGLPLPACPTLGMEPDATTITLTLGYGSGCNPRLYPTSTFSGNIYGMAFIAVNAFEFECEDLLANGDALDGRIAGGFTRSDGGTVFSVNLDLILNDGTGVNGTATVQVHDITGIITVTNATVHVNTTAGMRVAIVFTDLLADAAKNGTFIPESGRATVELPGDGRTISGQTVTIEFTTQTPVDGTAVYLTGE